MSTERLRFGVIGCGGIGPSLAAGAVEAPDVELVACADIVESAARDLAEERDIAPYTDYEEMIADADVEAVAVATPSGTHAEISIDCIERGAHVLCQKPLDVYVHRLDALIAAADEHDVKLAGVFPLRTHAASRRAKEAIEGGELGEIVLADTYVKWHRTQEYYDSGEWRGTRDLDGGCMFNQAVHGIDLAGWLMGGYESVYAHTDTVAHDMECEDVATVNVQYGNDAHGVIEATTAVYPQESTRVRVHGTEGSITVEGSDITQFETMDGEVEPDLDESEMGGFAIQIQDLAGAIREDREPMVSGRDARHAPDTIITAYESADRNEELRVADTVAELRERE